MSMAHFVRKNRCTPKKSTTANPEQGFSFFMGEEGGERNATTKKGERIQSNERVKLPPRRIFPIKSIDINMAHFIL